MRRLAGLMLLVSSAAVAHPSSWYADYSLGATVPSLVPNTLQNSSSQAFSPTAIGTSIFQLPNVNWQHRFAVGASTSLAMGLAWPNHWRTGGELLYQYMTRHTGGTFLWQERRTNGQIFLNDDRPNPIPAAASGAHVLALLGDLTYDFAQRHHWQPFVGAGLGVAWLYSRQTQTRGQLDVTSVNPFVQTTTPLQANSPTINGAALAWQLKLGLSYQIAAHCQLFALYRLLGTSATPVNTSVIISNPGTTDRVPFTIGPKRLSGLLNNSFEMGLSYRWGEGAHS